MGKKKRDQRLVRIETDIAMIKDAIAMLGVHIGEQCFDQRIHELVDSYGWKMRETTDRHEDQEASENRHPSEPHEGEKTEPSPEKTQDANKCNQKGCPLFRTEFQRIRVVQFYPYGSLCPADCLHSSPAFDQCLSPIFHSVSHQVPLTYLRSFEESNTLAQTEILERTEKIETELKNLHKNLSQIIQHRINSALNRHTPGRWPSRRC